MEKAEHQEKKPLCQDEERGDMKKKQNVWKQNSLMFLVIIIIMSAFAFVNYPTSCMKLFTFFGKERMKPKYKNVIFMVTDGTGPASFTAAREFQRIISGAEDGFRFAMDEMLVGSSRTRSFDSLVTDSAAGATAYSCGIKTNNDAVAVDEKGKPCGTLLEAAKRQGWKTGMIVTSRVTHATPASFAAHVKMRWNEARIAEQLIGEAGYPFGISVDLLMGGGKCFFMPSGMSKKCGRKDLLDLIDIADKKGVRIVSTRKEFDLMKENEKLPLFGLFADDHISYEIDRNPLKEPSLKEMVQKGLKILKAAVERDEAPGFFLLIEGSKIDLAAHSNDPATHIRELIHYEEMAEVVKQFVDENEGTLMISTSDHETGGLTLARQLTPAYPEYGWYPQRLFNITRSTEVIAEEILSRPPSMEWTRKVVFEEYLKITDATEAEVLQAATERNFNRLIKGLGESVSRRAEIGWSSSGHTGVDVNLYVYDGRKDKIAGLNGNVENVQVGQVIQKLMNWNLEVVTEVLQQMPPDDSIRKEQEEFHG